MSYDLNQKQFTLNKVLSYISTSVRSIAKSLLIAAPITVATILFATAAHAQTIKKDALSSAAETKSTIEPIAAPVAVRNVKPKGRETTGPRRPLRTSAPAKQSPAADKKIKERDVFAPHGPLRVGTPANQSPTADKVEKVKPPRKTRIKERDPFSYSK